MRKLLAAALSVAMGMSLAACGGGSSKPAEETTKSAESGADKAESGDTKLNADIEYWSSWSETEAQADALREAADEFMKANPGVKINFTFNGRDNRNLVGSAVSAGTKVTMMDANADNIKSMWSEMTMDLTPYFEESYESTGGEKYVDRIMPSMSGLSAKLFDGKYSYFPYAPQAFMIFCNKNIFDDCGITKYPETWTEFMDACEKIKAKGYTPVTTDSNYATSWVGYYMSRLMGNDEVTKLSNDPSAWSNPKVLEAAKAIEDMAKKGYFDPVIETNTYPNAQQSMVINEKIAMYINGTWLPNEVKESTPDDFKWGSFAFPTVEGGVDDQTSGCYSSYGIAINKDATEEEAKAAAAFGVYVTTAFDQKFSDMANAIPVSVDGVWPDSLKDAQQVMSKYTNRYPSQTALILNSNSKQIIADACLKLMGGSITAEEFVEMASKF
ncbi:extracellular solute-binding protein [Lachnoanaerobaculum orale]|uniref:Extracellular solute-binding protein n=1 Tax=Lachnoanaerobaculum orale TaxID=979627 RepID=A0A3P3Q5J5_9FIRM|nr:extracellular solute-binding protein [Lachnoanaerobaculum orale]RRJ16354.1 extracellular solute-binding protein [Lachnoanaerobaculum orale]